MILDQARIFEDLGIAVFWSGEDCFVLSADNPGTPVQVDPRRLLVSNDGEALGIVRKAIELSSLSAMLLQLYRSHNAWYFVGVALDATASESRRRRAVTSIERRLRQDHLPRLYVQTRLMLAPLPDGADQSGALELARQGRCDDTARLINGAGERQEFIARLSAHLAPRMAPLWETQDPEMLFHTGQALFELGHSMNLRHCSPGMRLIGWKNGSSLFPKPSKTWSILRSAI